MNEVGFDSNNASITDGRSLPWLQDTAEWDAWGRWDAVYRDVIVLDPENVPVAIYNLTDNDLGDAERYAELSCLLREAAAQLNP